jgi:hypothetical protein
MILTPTVLSYAFGASNGAHSVAMRGALGESEQKAHRVDHSADTSAAAAVD